MKRITPKGNRATVNEHKVLFRAHDTSGRTVRVWRESWPGDTFEIMASTQLVDMIRAAEKLANFFPALLFEEADDSEIEIRNLIKSPLLILTLSTAEDNVKI